MIPTVRRVTAAATLPGSMHQVTGSTSATTGRAPHATTAPATAANVNAGTTTSSTGPTSSACSTSVRADVPLLVVTVCATPHRADHAASKRSVYAPPDEI